MIDLVLCAIIAVAQETDTRASDIIERFYHGETVTIQEAEALVREAAQTTDSITQATLNRYIQCCTALSTVMAGAPQQTAQSLLKDFEQTVKPLIRTSKDSETLRLYAEYLYSKLLWGKSHFSIINQLPFWYTRNKFYTKDERASLDMARWYTAAANGSTATWNAFIRSQEPLIETAILSDSERFNLYVAYSLFYMKTLNTEKGLIYLEKARMLFPNSVHVALLERNYRRGVFHW